VIWDWSAFFHYLHSPYLLTGAAVSLGLSMGAMLIGLVFGCCAAMMRMSERRWIRTPASAYVWLFRGTPVLVQLIIIYTGLPQLGIKLGVLASALIGLGVNEGAYLAEIIRSGIMAVPKGQFEAASALGIPFLITLRKVVLPQAIRIVIPPMTSNCVSLFKDTSLASTVALPELLKEAQDAQAFYANPSPLIGMAVIYILFLWPMVRLVSLLERRFAAEKHR